MNIVSRDVFYRASKIKLLISDVDGVLTDTGVYYDEKGDALRRFSLRDGMGIERLRLLADVETILLSGEDSPSIKKRAEKLGITEYHLGIRDKLPTVRAIIQKRGLSPEEVAYIGDDLNDIEAMAEVGLRACPADAYEVLLGYCDYVCSNKGGFGAFREFAELIICAKKEGKGEKTGKGW
jgi:YrbI family 3-deoxy-D-manno-octulosonate 8-phosphate phosphatase